MLTSEAAVREVALASAAGKDAAASLEHMARLRHSQDNITVVVVYFDWGGAADSAVAVAGPPPPPSPMPPPPPPRTRSWRMSMGRGSPDAGGSDV